VNSPAAPQPAPVQSAPLPEVRNHTPYPSQYFQMLDVNDEIFHVIVSRLTCDLNRLDENGAPALAGQQAALVDADQFYQQPNTSSCIQESDFAPYKPKCDIVLAHATAYAPQGRPQQRWPVGLRVGNWQKNLTVTGPRQVKAAIVGWSATEPDKALAVPLRWEHAYGGTCLWPEQPEQGQKHKIKARYPSNPIGSGWVDKAWFRHSRVTQIDAPQIELFDRPFGSVQASTRDYPAIGVGPVGRWWSPRREKAGTYDQEWQETRWPRLPKDFDFGYWNCAPEDQQIDYPKGGEDVVLSGFRPEENQPLHCQLPQPHLHSVLRMHSGPIVALPMRLDTLVLNMKDMTLSCVYRIQIAAKAQARVLELRPGRAPA
jgi:hypothetical protein